MLSTSDNGKRGFLLIIIWQPSPKGQPPSSAALPNGQERNEDRGEKREETREKKIHKNSTN